MTTKLDEGIPPINYKGKGKICVVESRGTNNHFEYQIDKDYWDRGYQ